DPSRKGDDIAAVADVQRLIGEELVDFMGQPEWVDWSRVPHQAGEALLHQPLLFYTQRLDPSLAFASPLASAVRRRPGDRGQDCSHVAHEPEVHVAVLADRAVVHVDLDNGGLLGKALAVAHAEV